MRGSAFAPHRLYCRKSEPIKLPRKQLTDLESGLVVVKRLARFHFFQAVLPYPVVPAAYRIRENAASLEIFHPLQSP